ncbi:MAG: hypothetical protein AB7V46_02530 [Thermomicrobiales bacterium]
MNCMILPANFTDLADMAVRWGRPTEIERSEIRWNATAQDFATFYEAVMPRLDAIMAYLSGVNLDGMTKEDQGLFDLAAAFAEMAPHHELYSGSAEVPFSFSARRFVASHGDLVTREM